MKQKLFMSLLIGIVFVFVFAFGVSAEVTIYNDAPAKTNIVVSTDDVVVFDDGFCCPTGYVFKDVKEIANGTLNGPTVTQAFDFSYINGKTTKSYNFSNVVSVDFPQGMTYIGGYGIVGFTNLKRVSFPDTITGFGMAVLKNCTSLEECVFEHDENDGLTTLCPEFFENCSNLRAISLPDCMTTFGWNQHNLDGSYFKGCTNLGAIHLPKKLQVMYGQTDEKSVFGMLTNAYFVNEAFTYDNIPTKPEIYYFPSGLTTTTGTVFRSCKNLNSIMVFGESLTSITRGWELEEAAAGNGARPIVVFLGDMTDVNVNGWVVDAVYFVNENDIGPSSVSISGNQTIYYCNADSHHLTEKTVVTDAKCGVDEATISYCFCGSEIAKVVNEGTALSHDYDYLNSKATLVSLSYVSYMANGEKVVTCGKCGENGELESPALFTCLGYSAPEDGRGRIAIGFTVNNEAIAEYEKATGKTLKYGVFAVLKDRLGDNDVFSEDGTAEDGVIKAEITSYEFVAFELKIVGFTDEYKDIKLAMGAYVATIDGETTEYSYMQGGEPNENEKYCFVSYNDIVGKPSTDEKVTQ